MSQDSITNPRQLNMLTQFKKLTDLMVADGEKNGQTVYCLMYLRPKDSFEEDKIVFYEGGANVTFKDLKNIESLFSEE